MNEFQTRGMEVWHQKPYSEFYAAHAIVYESHDYCLKSVCCNRLTYLCLQVHCTEQSDDKADLCSVVFYLYTGSLELAPKGLCTSIIIRHPICGIFIFQSRYERCMPIKNIIQTTYILFIKILNSILILTGLL